MKKLLFPLFFLIITHPLYSQILQKNGWILDNPQPTKGLGGNGITNMIVQEFKDSTIIWVGTGSGLSRMNLENKQWFTYGRKHGLGLGGISAIAIEDSVIWVATVFDTIVQEGNLQSGGGLAYSLDGGANWKYVPQPGVTPVQNTTWDIAIMDSTVWIASFGGGLRKSTNWKSTDWLSPDFTIDWDIVSPDEYNFDPLEYLNHRPFSAKAINDVLWIGTAEGINKSLDGGKTWINFNHQNQENSISGNWVLAIADQQYGNKNIIWAATWETTSETGDTSEFRGISKSEDQGYTWKTYLRGESVYNFAFDDSVIYACSLNGLFKSIDGGKTWAVFPPIVDYEADERVYSEEVYSAGISKGHVLWVGTGDGLAMTTDDGFTWKIFRAFAPTGHSGEPRTYAYPNPFSPLRHNQLGGDGYIRFQYNTTNATNVTIRIFDFAMDLIATIVEDKPRPANRDFAEVWNGKTDDGELLANGVYFYQLKLQGDGTYWGKIIILD
ncbi:MAG: hypothetical protein JSW07_14410 [bacterium]|nr:MAG: hypothetical protein JSW07_14410 [bacterium]